MAAARRGLRRASRLEVLLLDAEVARLQNEPENPLVAGAALAAAFTNLVSKGGPLAKLHTHEIPPSDVPSRKPWRNGTPSAPLAMQVRKNEPKLVDLRTVLPDVRYPGDLDRLLPVPNVRALLDRAEPAKRRHAKGCK